MDSSDIKNLVLANLQEEVIPENLHNITSANIDDYLISPIKKKFINVLEDSIEEHWVVFDEDRNSCRGYLIFYSEKDQAFGIGVKSNLRAIDAMGTFIGVYGSFTDAIGSL